MSAANLHLLILADQRVEHEDEGKEVEVDGEADLEEHVGDRFSSAGGRQLSTAGSDPCLNCVSLCVVGQKRHRSPQLSGETEPGLFPLIWENRMD